MVRAQLYTSIVFALSALLPLTTFNARSQTERDPDLSFVVALEIEGADRGLTETFVFDIGPSEGWGCVSYRGEADTSGEQRVAMGQKPSFPQYFGNV